MSAHARAPLSERLIVSVRASACLPGRVRRTAGLANLSNACLASLATSESHISLPCISKVLIMSRVTVLLWLIIQITVHSARSQGSSSIEWGKPVSYSDFGSSPDKADTAAANISVTILLGYSNTKSGTLKFRVVAVMDKDQSWMKKEFRKDHILRHEQGHFDIAQIYARKLDTALKKKRYTSKDVAALNALYDDYLGQMNELQLRYDRETKGGWDGLAQSKWRRFILRELGNY